MFTQQKIAELAAPFGTMLLGYLPRVLLALITLWIGFRLVGFAVMAAERMMRVRHVDTTVSIFFQSAIGIVLKIMILLSVAAMVGVQTTSFIAFLGATTLAVGMSLQGSLANLAGGILILFFKPFKVGDDIEALTKRGRVERIEIFYTMLTGENGMQIIMPNGALSNGVIINYSRKG